MTQPESNYTSASGPVNLRTTAVAPPPVNPLVQERLEANLARRRLGTPLAGQMAPATAPVAADAGLIAGAIGATLAGIALFLAWLQGSWLLALAGLGSLVVAAGLLVWRVHRQRRAHHTAPSVVAPVQLDPQSLAALDQALTRLLTEVPEDLVARLVDLKALLVRVCQQMGAAADEHFTLEDRFYVHQCVRRYLPDSVHGYLRVPPDQRELSLAPDGQTALGLLRAQLALIDVELKKKDEKLARSAAGHLQRQQRFLESKASRD